VKRLIVNADDFGLTRGVNRAIVECHQRGIVTSTTLMATSDEFQNAVELAKRLTSGTDQVLGIGCHVVLADGRPVLPASQVPSLVVRETGLFHRSIQQLAKHALTHRFRAEEIEAEATAQFRKIQAAGIRISHFDAHKHAHIFPSILRPLLRAAAVCGVPALRNPFEPIFSMPIPGLLRIPVRYAEVLALRAFRARFHSMVAESGLRTTDGSLGLIATGTLNVANISALLDRLQEGVWELVCHPGYNDAQLAAADTRLRASRETEMQALTADSSRTALERNGLQLISFRELTGDSRAGLNFGAVH
jgi:hopanoid biosynthesis associated protein HpnK